MIEKPALQTLGKGFQEEVRPRRGMISVCVQSRKMLTLLKPGKGVSVSGAGCEGEASRSGTCVTFRPCKVCELYSVSSGQVLKSVKPGVVRIDVCFLKVTPVAV